MRQPYDALERAEDVVEIVFDHIRAVAPASVQSIENFCREQAPFVGEHNYKKVASLAILLLSEKNRIVKVKGQDAYDLP